MRLVDEKTSVQDLEAEMARLYKINSASSELKRAVTRFERELADAWEQGNNDLAALQARANADRDMLHAAMRGLDRLQSSLNPERQKRQGVKHTTTELRTRFRDH